MSQGMTLPVVTFKTRVRDESIGGDNPFRWQDVSSDELFGSKATLVELCCSACPVPLPPPARLTSCLDLKSWPVTLPLRASTTFIA